jgi:hypothetical protein
MNGTSRIHRNLDSGERKIMNMEWYYMILGTVSSETRGLKDISFVLYLKILPSKSKESFLQGLKVFLQERPTS